MALSGALLALAGQARAQCEAWAEDLSVGLDLYTYAIESIDLGNGPELFAGGDFLFVGSTPARSVARWNGTAWEPMGQLAERGVHCFAGFDDGRGTRLWAGTADTISSMYSGEVHSWNGTSWELEGVVDGYVWALAVHDDGSGPALYASGRFGQIDGVVAHNVARRVGSSWEAVGSGGTPSDLTDLQVWDDGTGTKLYASSIVGQARVWDGVEWTLLEGSFGGALPFNASTRRVEDLAVHDDGTGEALYACGSFATNTAGDAVGVGRWTGSEWVALGAAPDAAVDCLISHDLGDGRGPLLIAGGNFQNIGGVAAQRIATWDGERWEPLQAGGTSALPEDFAVFPGDGPWPALWTVGRFQKAGGNPSEHVARLENPCVGQGTSYCTAGTTASGCSALVSSTGTASRSLASGFQVDVDGVEGGAPGLIYFGTSGQQALPWGNGTSVRCVVPPLVRTGLDMGSGTSGLCDGAFQLDFNAWMTTHPSKAPTGGQSVSMQAWFRDPASTSNQVTSLSDGLRFVVLP